MSIKRKNTGSSSTNDTRKGSILQTMRALTVRKSSKKLNSEQKDSIFDTIKTKPRNNSQGNMFQTLKTTLSVKRSTSQQEGHQVHLG